MLKKKANQNLRWLLSSLALVLASGLNLATPSPALAEVVQWKSNGHYYEVVAIPAGITWLESREAAKSKGGYLASLTTKQENLFVWSLIAGKPQFWASSIHDGKSDAVGPWIGLFQQRHQIQEPGGGWGWVSAEPFSYANWAPGKPNNLEEIEDYGQFFIVHGSKDVATWNDLPNDALRLTKVQAKRPVAYIVEYDTLPKR